MTQGDSSLGLRLRQGEQEQIRKAMRALLDRPLLPACGAAAEDHALVRRHAAALQKWLEHNTGWRLEVSSQMARLHKTPANAGDGGKRDRD